MIQMPQSVQTYIQDLKFDHLPKPRVKFLKSSFYVKILLDGKEHFTGPILNQGEIATAFTNNLSLEAFESAFLEIELYARHLISRDELVGSVHDTLHNFLKRSSTIVLALWRMDRHGVSRKTAFEVTFSINRLPQHDTASSPNLSVVQSDRSGLQSSGNLALPDKCPEPIQQAGERKESITEDIIIVNPLQNSSIASLTSSLEQSDQSVIIHSNSAHSIVESDARLNFLLHVNTIEWDYELREQEQDQGLHLVVNVDAIEQVHCRIFTKTTHWDQNLTINGRLSSMLSIEIMKGDHDSSESLVLARAATCFRDLLERCADGDGAVLELSFIPSVPDTGEHATAVDDIHGTTSSSPKTMGLITFKIRRLPNTRGQIEESALALANYISSLDEDRHAQNLSNLGEKHYTRYELLGELVDLENSIASRQQAVALTPNSLSDKADRLSNLGVSYLTRFERLGNLEDIQKAVVNFQQAIILTMDGHPHKPTHLSNLGNAYSTRFDRLGDLADLEESIANQEKAVVLTLERHPNKANYLISLGNGYHARFDRLGDLTDLERSIASFQQANLLTPDGHPNKVGYLSNLGIGYATRFDRLGDLSDLENGIVSCRQAVKLTPDGHSDKAAYLTNLGIAYGSRFERLGDLADLEKSIVCRQQAVSLSPDGHADKANCLFNLGNGYSMRFDRVGVLSDLQVSITYRQQAVELTPDGHPDKANYLSKLGHGYHTRFDRLGKLSDLEESIALFQQAVSLTPEDHPGRTARLADLGTGYNTRFERLGDPSDLAIAIAFQQQAVALTPSNHPNKAMYLTNLAISYGARFARFGDMNNLNDFIAFQQKAISLTPDGHPDKAGRLSSLGNSYGTRFDRLGDLADLEESIASRQKAVALTPESHPERAGNLSNLGTGLNTRFERLGDLSDLQQSIISLQQAVSLIPDGHPDKAGCLSNLGYSYGRRFERLGNFTDLEKSIVCPQRAVALTPDGHPDKAMYLASLGAGYGTRFDQLGDISDLENSIADYQRAVSLTPEGHPEKPMHLSNIGGGYSKRFWKFGELADLEKSIANRQQAVALTPDGHPNKSLYYIHLGQVYHVAWEHDRLDHHLLDAISSMKSAAQSLGGSPGAVLFASRTWANLALTAGLMPSALDAFRTAIETLPQVAWLGLAISSRQEWLAKEEPEMLSCMAATCAIRLGRFEDAVELMDMARSVFWQQSSSLRNDLQDLRAERPELAEELESVSNKLDASSFSELPSKFAPSGITQETSADHTLFAERRLAQHRQLVLQREKLIEKIRGEVVGFEFFLKPTPFNRLRESVMAGPIIIINVSELGADALSFNRDGPIHHVPLPNVNTTNLSKYTDRLAQKKTRADVTQERLRSRTLPAVWNDIVKPIFTELGIPLECPKDQAPTKRIFWYITGPLTFIPIHAAGPISRLVISSYVTTLSSLLEAQKRHSSAIVGFPRVLAIAQPNTPGKKPIPHATDEINTVMETLAGKGWPSGSLHCLERADATVDQVSTALNSCSWVHFACHAMQDPRDGMESAFALHDGGLKLSLIASKRLSFARLAFLSACQSASGLQDSPGEAMHLSAGMQFAGFSSVIATLWSIWDEDAPIVAEHTYAYLLRNGVDDIDLTETATALNYAVSKLREDPKITLERWAPFVHFGV